MGRLSTGLPFPFAHFLLIRLAFRALVWHMSNFGQTEHGQSYTFHMKSEIRPAVTVSECRVFHRRHRASPVGTMLQQLNQEPGEQGVEA